MLYTTWEIADVLKKSKSSAENHLHWPGYVHHFHIWVPCKLNEKNLNCISIWNSVLERNKKIPFLKQIVMGNEKRMLYSNVD